MAISKLVNTKRQVEITRIRTYNNILTCYDDVSTMVNIKVT